MLSEGFGVGNLVGSSVSSAIGRGVETLPKNLGQSGVRIPTRRSKSSPIWASVGNSDTACTG
jgi:hypothetical protein